MPSTYNHSHTADFQITHFAHQIHSMGHICASFCTVSSNSASYHPSVYWHIFRECTQLSGTLFFHISGISTLHMCYSYVQTAIAEGPRDASCHLKSCQLPRNSAETTCTKFEVSRFTRYDAMNGGAKCRIWGGLGQLGALKVISNVTIW